MTQEQVILELRLHIARYYKGKQKPMAQKLEISSALLSSVLNGHRQPCEIILRELGLKKQITVEYVEVEEVT